MAEINIGRVAKTLEDPAYVAVGFGVLGYQRAQVHRRAWQRRLSRLAAYARARSRPAPPPPPRRPTVTKTAVDAVERLGPLVQEVAGLAAQRLGPLVSDAAERVVPLVTDAAGRVAPMVSDAAERVGPLVSEAAERVAPMVSDAAERVGPLVSEAAEHLPPEAHELLRAAGDLINDIPGDARELAREAVARGRSVLHAFWAPPGGPGAGPDEPPYP